MIRIPLATEESLQEVKAASTGEAPGAQARLAGRRRELPDSSALVISINSDLERFVGGRRKRPETLQRAVLCICFSQRNPRPFPKVMNLGFRHSDKNWEGVRQGGRANLCRSVLSPGYPGV